MREGLLGLALFAAAVIGLGVVSIAKQHTTAALSDDARTAIEIRCGQKSDAAARECRETLTRLFAAGALDPDRVLRQYCEAVRQSGWGGYQPRPPAICVKRYGGWRSG